MTSRLSHDFPDQVLFKHKSKMTSDCCVFKFLQRGLDRAWISLSNSITVALAELIFASLIQIKKIINHSPSRKKVHLKFFLTFSNFELNSAYGFVN